MATWPSTAAPAQPRRKRLQVPNTLAPFNTVLSIHADGTY
jgi:hypothetical protein